MKKLLSLLLVFVFVLGITACGKKGNEKETGTQGGYSSNTESEYEDTVSEWQGEGESDGEFDNTGGEQAPATPGSESQTVVLNNPVADNKDGQAATDSFPSLDERNFPTSNLADKESLQFFYEGDIYAYGITESGIEYIAYKSPSGEMLDAITGAGKYILNTSTGTAIVVTGVVDKFESLMKDGYPSVIVDYKTSGMASYAEVKTTYMFKEYSINVSAQINAESDSNISYSRSQFIRGFVKDYIDSEVKINSDWVYPANGDFPYPDFESLCYKHQLTKDVYMYSFMRGEDIPTQYAVAALDPKEMELTFADGKGLYYTHQYDLTFVDTLVEYQQSSDYRGLFKSYGSDFAAGVAPVDGSDDNSTVFVGDSVKLNINVTNLTADDLKFSLRYDVRDYYGNIVDKGLFIDSTVFEHTGANRQITVGGKYGIYYLNLYVISKYSTYKECYPFALIKGHEYKYNATSPFGINSANTKNQTEVENTAKIFAKIGVANARVNGDMVPLAKELHKNGITRLNGIMGSPFENTGGTATYLQEAEKVLDKLSPYIDSFEVGNEMNLQVMQGKYTMDELYPIFYNYTFVKMRELMQEKYPNVKYIPSPFSAGEQAWIDQLTKGYILDTDKDGTPEQEIPAVWDDLDIVSTHIYGNPWMPDEYSSFEPAYKAGTWCIEGALQRLEECFKKYCDDPAEKDFYVTEFGYGSSAGDPAAVGLRTHADYLIRSSVLCAAYGADRIQYYCMYDRTIGKSGFYNVEIPDSTLTMNEYNFGVFYEADYYGRFMPKPAAIAFAVMTQQLESINKNSAEVFDKYDEGYDVGGVRAFKCTTATDGEVVIAYSNSEVLSNGKKGSDGKTGLRTPNLPWNNQWSKTDATKFQTKGDKATVVDIMGNTTVYEAENGYVTIPLTGSPVYIYGVK